MEECDFTYIGHIRPQPAWSLPTHRHDRYHELICVVSGNIETSIRGQVLCGGAGDVLFYPEGEDHAERAVGPNMLETLFVSFSATGTSEWPLMRHDRNGRIGVLARWMEDFAAAIQREKPFLQVLLQAMLREYQSLVADPEVAGINLARRYAEEHLAEPLRLEQLATVAGLSRFHFARRFRRSTGASPMRYLRELRVHRARTLLLTTDWPLKTIAPHVGFADEYQLCRVFKHVTGLSPSSLR